MPTRPTRTTDVGYLDHTRQIIEPFGDTGDGRRAAVDACDCASPTTLTDRSGDSLRAFGVYGCLILSFGTGALIGAELNRALDVRAIWLPAGLIALAGVMFVLEQRSTVDDLGTGAKRQSTFSSTSTVSNLRSQPGRCADEPWHR